MLRYYEGGDGSVDDENPLSVTIYASDPSNQCIFLQSKDIRLLAEAKSTRFGR